MECNFCKVFNILQEVNEGWTNKRKYYSKICETAIVNGKEKGETNSGRFKLNYCPECGKRLEVTNNQTNSTLKEN